MVEKIEKNVLTAWERVEIARNPKRKTALDYINEIFDEFIELHGDRCYGDDKAMVCGLGRIENQNYTIIAEQKGRNTKENIERNFGMPNPESYRKAIRIMKQAEKFNRPVITFIDTKGAYPGVEAEQRGQGEAIAKSMFEMAKLTVPVIAIVIGEGSSGGALAIGVANKVIMLENAIYSILSPEGYSSILWKDSSRFKEAADRMKLTANDLYDMGIIETVIKESIENYTIEKNQNIKKTTDIEMKSNMQVEELRKTLKENKINDNEKIEKELFKNITDKIKQEIQTTVQELKSKTKDEIVEERYQKFRKISGFKEV
ncbi:MAG: acetyl-CoA carboxylase carboxyltransferase subunit alpha [Clostridium sp.]|jgi:acetyl-CoA carboxylase carboxyl transferase subunit alpha|nr:acetyl-CoA carboxylase carboxyltransferase subunit alpha [Clostridium sp.]